MSAKSILSQPAPQGQPDPQGRPFPYAAYHAGIRIPLPDAPRLNPQTAARFLAATQDRLRLAAVSILVFREALAGPGSRADFEDAYNRLIVPNGLQVWLGPVEAADLWAAREAVGR